MLDAAFAGLVFKESEQTASVGTDGNLFFFSVDYVLRAFRETPDGLTHAFLHLVLHGIFSHLLRPPACGPALWGLACDMAVEQILERENVFDRKDAEDGALSIRRACFAAAPVYSVFQYYVLLKDGSFPFAAEEMEAAFCFDDHRFWGLEDGSRSADGLRRKWDKIRAHASGSRSGGAGAAGSAGGASEEELSVQEGGYCSYRDFLKRFTVLREEMELDTESFDYISYSYGMERYGNIPLIEPLECREVNRLEELVIAIDTSGSCSGEMVADFLAQTYAILEEKENFFSKMKVYVVQCDCCIQDVRVIRSEKELRASGQTVRIQGRGGTDFRPVFRLADRLRESGELRNLRALIYFTDGDGVYPETAPEYETAFVFIERTPGMEKVPGWAHRFCTKEPSYVHRSVRR